MNTNPPVIEPNRPPSQSALKTITASRPAVLAILFCVTGALGLPLLWKSPSFSKEEKTLWTVIVTIYTFALLCGTGTIVLWAYQSVMRSIR